MVSGRISGTSPESTSTCSKLCNALRACIMACPVPRCSRLQHKIDAGGSQRRAHRVRFVTDDGEDILRRDHLRGSRDHVRQQRLAADLVQHLGMARLQPRAFAGGKNGDGEHEVRLVVESELWLAMSPFSGDSEVRC